MAVARFLETRLVRSTATAVHPSTVHIPKV